MPLRSTRFDVRRYGADTERHVHDHHQLVLPLSGVLEMDVGGTQDAVAGRQAAAIPAGRPHGFAGSRDNAFLIVDIPAGTGDAGHEPFWTAVAERPFVGFDPALQGFCDFIAGQVPRLGFQGLRAEVAGGLVIESLSEGLGLAPSTLSRPLARALEFIETRYAEPITVAAIARHAGLSESRLHAQFKTRFGLSPARAVARLRLRRAAALLAGTALPMAEIALRVGYGDQSAFARAFQRAMNETPGDYRRARQDRHEKR